MRQRKKIPLGREAFTMIEVMLAATVLLFAIVSAFQLVVAGARMLDFSRNQTIATQIIRAEIDRARLVDWATIVRIEGDTDTVNVSSIGTSNTWENRSLGYPELLTLKNVASGFTVKRVVSALPNPTNGRTDWVTITFTVTWTAKMWTGASTRTYSRQGTTYVSKYGLSTTFQRS